MKGSITTAVFATAVLVVAVAAIAAYIILPGFHTENTAVTPTATVQPTPTSTVTSNVNGTGPAPVTLTVSSLGAVNTTQTISAGTVVQFTVTLTNPNPRAQPSYPCNFQFVLTEQGVSRAALPSDAVLGVYTEGIYDGQPDAAYSHYVNVNATADHNALTYLWAPQGYYDGATGGFSSHGFTVTSCFNETFTLQLTISAVGTYSLAVNLVATP